MPAFNVDVQHLLVNCFLATCFLAAFLGLGQSRLSAGTVNHGSFGAPVSHKTSSKKASPNSACRISLRHEDRWFEINTRQIAWCSVARLAGCQVWACYPGGRLIPGTLAEFQVEYQQRPTLLYVHGYDNNAEDARKSALEIYQFARQSAHCPPLNIVVWSWPSDRQGVRVVDARIKAERSDFESGLFGQFLQIESAEQPLALVAFSLGARVVAGGLQRQAVAPQTFPQPSATQHRLSPASASFRRAPIRTLFVAAAIDSQWMSPQGRYGSATRAVDRLINLVNHRDPALRRYHLITQQHQSEAIGAVGIPRWAGGGGLLQQFDVTAEVGRSHRLTNYLQSPKVVAQLRALLVPIPLSAANQPVSPLSTADVAHDAPPAEPESGAPAHRVLELGPSSF